MEPELQSARVMHRPLSFLRRLSLLAVAPSLAACGLAAGAASTPDPPTNGACTPPTFEAVAEEAEPAGIHAFSSEAELDGYVTQIEARAAEDDRVRQAAYEAYAKCMGNAGNGAVGADAGAAASQGAAPEAKGTSNETITNNQEDGVDEGGIVKNVGGSLVVLRQGRLYVVDVAGAAPVLVDSMRVARSDALNKSVWYDEMLVKGDLVYVVGYRYGAPGAAYDFRGATEVDSFRIVNGKLTRLRSMFLESNDYYSGKNYASRLTGGKLVFYMPHHVGRRGAELAYPRVLHADESGSFGAIGPIFGALDVTTSLVKPRYAAFHTVVQCELPTTGAFDCHARSVLGSSWREHYVTGEAVYLWASSHVYRFDFASLDVTAHRATGAPVDQFSFRKGESELFVAVNAPTDPQKPWGEATASLLRLPLAAFDKQGGQAAVTGVALGPQGTRLGMNRFVGDTLVAGVQLPSTGSAGGYDQPGGELVARDPLTGAESRAPISGLVRLEPLGEGRVVAMTSSTAGLAIDTFATSNVTASLGHAALDGIRQGEGRSHGFFFKPDAAGTGAGMFGYAVVNDPARGAAWGWGNGISNIGFFRVGAAGNLATAGIVSAGTATTHCETSCIDWYGNTRPIFLGQRTFALMGSELSEVVQGEAFTKGASAELAPRPGDE